MSVNEASSSLLDAATVSNIAYLARIQLDQNLATHYAKDLNNILIMMDNLADIDTDQIEPMFSPFDRAQPLRTDKATETDQREAYQAVAPQIEQGLYLVPKVIE